MPNTSTYVIGACLLGGGFLIGTVSRSADPHALVASNPAASARSRITSADVLSPIPPQSGPVVQATPSAFDLGLQPHNYMFMAMMGSLAVAWRLRKKPTVDILSITTTTGKAHADPYIDRTAAFMTNATNSNIAVTVPRELLKNPYGPAFNHLSFDERVNIAIEASLRARRVIGVIHFFIDTTHKGEVVRKEDGPGPVMRELAERFRKRLRPSDCVRLMGENEIAVFISLLSNTTDLQSIATRLSRVVTESGLCPAPARLPKAGLAIYPVDGYLGTELIRAAKKRTAPLDLPPLASWKSIKAA